MRAVCLAVMGCACAGAQTGYDINGRRLPAERVEERVVEQDGSRRVVERLVRRYDQNGNPGRLEKVRIEERKNPDGSTAAESLTWRSDVNGRLQLAERKHSEARSAGNEVRTNIVIERPALDGAFQAIEKRAITERKTGAGVQQETVTWRRDSEGRFGEILREVTEITERNGLTTENTARYDTARSGTPQLASQTVSRTVKNADGSQRAELDLFRVIVPGRPVSATPQLIEQQIVERRPGAAGTTVERVSVRRPAPDGSKPAGPYHKISERVCAGECQPDTAYP